MEKWREKYRYEEEMGCTSDLNGNDILNILEAKERDLILAAELGKALLEKNEELSQQNEKIAKDFSEKLEVLEQEKYQLKKQLEIAEEEYEQKLFDLQADIANLRDVVDKHAADQKQAERHSSQLVNDLTEQNQRLTSQLKVSGANEKEMRNQITKLKEQFNNRKITIQEHFGHVESLRDEISAVMDKKTELENYLKILSKEREKDQLLRNREKDIEELQASNHHLLERLETLSGSRSSSPSCNLSLLSELEMSASDQEKQGLFDIIEETDEEFDFDTVEGEDLERDVADVNLKSLRNEVLSAYHQLRNMSMQLRLRKRKSKAIQGVSMETSSSGSSVEVVTVQAGQLDQAVQELKALLHQFLRKESRTNSTGSQGCQICGRSLQEKQSMEIELHQTIEQIERGNIGLKQMELEAKQKDTEIQRIRSKLMMMEARLAAAEEEREMLKKDVEESSLSKESLIKSAWSSRDAAVERKNVAEVELARTRIESMQVNSQLIEAVQQKVTLSQQLEEWEVDLQVMLQEQVKNKMVQNTSSQSDKTSSSDSERSTEIRKISRSSSIMSFFSSSK